MEYAFLFLLIVGVAWWLHEGLKRNRAELRVLRERLARQQRALDELRAGGAPAPAEESREQAAQAPSLAAQVLAARDQRTGPSAPTTPTASAPPPLSAPAEPAPAAAPATEAPAPPPLPKPPPVAPPASAASSPAPPPRRREIDWEQFLGVKLFAWVGGFALFLAAAFFVKYSFENNLVSPAMRVTTGFVAGLGLLVGGTRLRKRDYAVTAQTLCATGVVILYATCYACHAFYGFTGATTTFLLMSLVTLAAFGLAVRMEAQVVAILGLLGGFLTPPLLSTGVDHAFGLFGYVLLLDVGLLAVALHRRWDYLALLGALGTALTETGWRLEFFDPGKTGTLLAILVVFNLLFLGAVRLASRWQRSNAWLGNAALLPPLVSFLAALSVVFLPVAASRPVWFFAIILVADVCWLWTAHGMRAAGRTMAVGGGIVFLLLATWSGPGLRETNLGWTLVAYLLFGLGHGVLPLLPSWRAKFKGRPAWVNVFPVATLCLFVLPLLQGLGLGLGLWAAAFVLALFGVGLALVTGSRGGLLASGLVAFVVLACHALNLPTNLGAGAAFWTAALIGLFGLLFVGVTTGLAWVGGATAQTAEENGKPPSGGPALSGLLPFLLLGLVCLRLPLDNPGGIFATGLVLALTLLAAGRLAPGLFLEPAALAGVLLMELAWRLGRFTPETAVAPLAWAVAFTILFLAWPFLAWGGRRPPVLPWATAAVAPMLHFFLIRDLVQQAWAPGHPGWLPALFVPPVGAALWWLVRQVDSEAPQRNTLLAWFGGATLLFITLIFPLQFERQWLTLGWAFEGAALLGLYRRVPHRGLRLVGLLLLVAAFARLMVNPMVLEAGGRSGVLLFNWLLYTYGLGAAAMFLGAALLGSSREGARGMTPRHLLLALGTVTLFALMNLEIADYFSAGDRIDLAFSGSLARDMTYSIGWALFAIVLLAVGVVKRARAVRYASAGLLVVTLLKLFLHDLVNLSAPYRIGAFFGVAVVAILASVLYQRFFAGQSNDGT